MAGWPQGTQSSLGASAWMSTAVFSFPSPSSVRATIKSTAGPSGPGLLPVTPSGLQASNGMKWNSIFIKEFGDLPTGLRPHTSHVYPH